MENPGLKRHDPPVRVIQRRTADYVDNGTAGRGGAPLPSSLDPSPTLGVVPLYHTDRETVEGAPPAYDGTHITAPVGADNGDDSMGPMKMVQGSAPLPAPDPNAAADQRRIEQQQMIGGGRVENPAYDAAQERIQQMMQQRMGHPLHQAASGNIDADLGIEFYPSDGRPMKFDADPECETCWLKHGEHVGESDHNGMDPLYTGQDDHSFKHYSAKGWDDDLHGPEDMLQFENDFGPHGQHDPHRDIAYDEYGFHVPEAMKSPLVDDYAMPIHHVDPWSPQYDADYKRGWAASREYAENGDRYHSGELGDAPLDKLDDANASHAAYDGYYDDAAGRRPYTLRAVRRLGLDSPEDLSDEDWENPHLTGGGKESDLHGHDWFGSYGHTASVQKQSAEEHEPWSPEPDRSVYYMHDKDWQKHHLWDSMHENEDGAYGPYRGPNILNHPDLPYALENGWRVVGGDKTLDHQSRGETGSGSTYLYKKTPQGMHHVLLNSGPEDAHSAEYELDENPGSSVYGTVPDANWRHTLSGEGGMYEGPYSHETLEDLINDERRRSADPKGEGYKDFELMPGYRDRNQMSATDNEWWKRNQNAEHRAWETGTNDPSKHFHDPIPDPYENLPSPGTLRQQQRDTPQTPRAPRDPRDRYGRGSYD